MRISVLVTTMHATNLSKYKEMHLQTDAVIANQTDKNEIIEENFDGHTAKLVSTNTRGLSRNRNIALAHSGQNVDLIVFADDDLVFNDGYENMIADEFAAHPEADAIKFNLHDLSETRKISMKRIERFEKATRRNMSASGVCGLAVKTAAFRKYNYKFDERFGSGTAHPSGEDTIFLMRMIDSGIRFYRSPVDIAGIDQTESSWFTGHNAKFFETAGRMIDVIYPRLSKLIVLRSAYRFSRRKDRQMNFRAILKCYHQGIKANRKGD